MAKDRLLKNTFIYFLGSIATRLINLLMLPIYTLTINKADLGYYSFVYTTVLSVVMPALFFMVWDVYLRFAIDSANEEERQSVATNVLLSTGALMAVYLLIFFILSRIWHIEYAFPIALIALAWPLSYIWQSGMRSCGENKAYAISGTVATVVNILVSLLFILVLKLPALSQYISQAAALFTIFLIAEPRIKLFKKVKLKRFDWGLMKRMLSFGSPLIINSVAFWLISSVGMFAIKVQLGDAANGIFSAASRFSMVIATLTQIIYFAWQEEAFREAKSGKLQGYMSEMLQLYITVLFAGVCFGLPLLKVVFPWLIKGDYTVAWVYLPGVILTAVYSALSTFASTAFSAKMKTGIVMTTTLTGGAVSALVAWFGLKLFGMQAVAVSGGIGFLIAFLMRVRLSRKTVPIQVNWPVYVALNLAVFLTTAAFYVNSLLLQLLVSAAGLALFLFLNRKLIATVMQAIRSRGKGRGGAAPPPTEGIV